MFPLNLQLSFLLTCGFQFFYFAAAPGRPAAGKPATTLFTGSQAVAEKLAVDLRGKVGHARGPVLCCAACVPTCDGVCELYIVCCVLVSC